MCGLQAKEVSIKALERLSTLNRRTLDVIAARIYFYYAWSHEQMGQLADVRRCAACPRLPVFIARFWRVLLKKTE